MNKELKEILIGLFLGDLCAQKRTIKGNTNFHFEQGTVHKDYINHLYSLFSSFCLSEPKLSQRIPDKRTGKIYSRIQFVTLSLPCFNEFYFLFYSNKKKIVPVNIKELFTPLSLACLICDDGYYHKKENYVIIATNSYTKKEVDLLIDVLNNKFNLISYSLKDGNGNFVIRISSKSIVTLQTLLKPLIPEFMKYKIGL